LVGGMLLRPAKMQAATAILIDLIPQFAAPGAAAGGQAGGVLHTGDSRTRFPVFESLVASLIETPKPAAQPNLSNADFMPASRLQQLATVSEQAAPVKLTHNNPESRIQAEKRRGETNEESFAQLGSRELDGISGLGGASLPLLNSQAVQPAEPAAQNAEPATNVPLRNLPALPLAFAMRIEARDGITNQTSRTLTTAGSTMNSDQLLAQGVRPQGLVESVAKLAEQQEDSAHDDTRAFFAEQEQAVPVRVPSCAPVGQMIPANRADFETELKQTAGTVRGAHVQVVGSDNQRVDIQLMERGGSLAVSVRTSDSALTRDLQDHIPELTSRLESEHFHSHAWTSGGSSSSNSRDAGGSPDPGPHDPEAGEGRRQRRQSDEAPQWVRDLEKNQRSSKIKEIFHVSNN
jgi:hypothetical protein